MQCRNSELSLANFILFVCTKYQKIRDVFISNNSFKCISHSRKKCTKYYIILAEPVRKTPDF